MQISDSEHLSQVLATLYDATLDPNLWPDALKAACTFLDGATATIFWQDPIVQSAMVFHDWNEDPAYRDRYLNYYANLNPFFPAATFIEPGLVFSGCVSIRSG